MVHPMARSLGYYLPEQLVLKLTLADSDPPIWRRVEVHSGLSLDDLHYVIQSVFMWDNAHLYQFLVPPGGKLTQKAMREARRYHVMPPDPFFEEGEECGRADQEMIGHIFRPECKQIVYEYDFGDSWETIVKLEKRTRGGDPEHVPLCLAGENAAPFDDMGGISGYYQWLDSLRDKDDEMHEEAVELLGKDFHETHFDLNLANKRLEAVFRPSPKKKRKKPK